MMEITSEHSCTGCAACQNICPMDAITMDSVRRGFRYPEIDQSKCVNCGKCIKVCPANRDSGFGNQPLLTYAFRHKERDVRMRSTSGGAFTAISDAIFLRQGVVYGAAFDESLNLVHMSAPDRESRDQIRGAKYIQSVIGLTFRDVKKDLQQKKQVLFTGTPCQVAGLKSFLAKDYDNLYTVDIVCHGVPSREVWRAFITCLSEKIGEVSHFDFRYKPNGWHGSKIRVITKKGDVVYNTHLTRSFSDIYFGRYIIRESCRDCKYKCDRRTGDITIGDFWGFDDYDTTYKDEQGVSLVLVNTPQGKALIEKIREAGDFREASLDRIPQTNINKKSENQSRNTEKFWDDFVTKGYEYVAKKYTEYGWNNRLKKRIMASGRVIFRKIRGRI